MTPTTMEEKAAVLLKSLPPNKAEGLLARLDPGRRERLRSTMNRLGQEAQSPEVLDQVVRDFAAVLQRGNQDTVETSRRPQEKTDNQIDGSSPGKSAQYGNDALASLRELNIDHLAAALETEQPRTIALVLNQLEPNFGGEVLKRLPSELRREVSPRLGKAREINKDLVPCIARALARQCQLISQRPARQSDDAKFKKTADMLRQLDKAARTEMLTALEGQDAETAARVREFLYQFEDLLRLEDRSIQKLLGEIDVKTLALAIKGARDELAQRVLDNLSKRARDVLTEEMGFLSSIPASQIQQAQKVVVDAIQRLDQAGELVMKQ